MHTPAHATGRFNLGHAALLLITSVALLLPAAWLAVETISSAAQPPRPGTPPIHLWQPVLIAKSLGWAAGIGLLAATFAAPLAWIARARRGFSTALTLWPMLVPPYLISSAWGTLRAPGSALGDWVARRTQAGDINLGDRIDAGVAVIALALWAAPLAALIVSPAARAISRSTLDALALDAPRWARLRMLARLLAPSLAAAFALVTLLMLGSAIPLHLARLDTLALTAWTNLELLLPSERWRAWLACWPLIVLAVAGSLWIARRARTTEAPIQAAQESPGASPDLLCWLFLALFLILAVLAPLGLLAWSIHDGHALLNFWKTTGGELAGSALVAAAVGAIGALLAAATAYAASAGRRSAAQPAALIAWAVAALLPGVLLGSAVAGAWNWSALSAPVADTQAIVILAHTARFGVVAVALGLFLAAGEPRDTRDARLLDGADRPRARAAAALAPHAPVLLAAALGQAALSLHEIESAVFVLPPGGASFARTMLNHLHFQRTQDMAAAMLWLAVLIAAAFIPTASVPRLLRRT